MKIANLVIVIDSQYEALAQVSQQRLVDYFVVQRKHGLDVFPIAYFGSDAGTTQFFRPVDQMIQGKQIFCFEEGFDNCVLVTARM